VEIQHRNCNAVVPDPIFFPPPHKRKKAVWLRETKGHRSLAWPDRFFPFFFVVAEKGFGDLTIGFPCDKIARFWRVLIADDEPKRGVKDLWDYVSQLYILINSRDQYKRDIASYAYHDPTVLTL